MRLSVAVLCHHDPSIQIIEGVSSSMGADAILCRSAQEALERVMDGTCSMLLVDFDLPGASDAIKMADFLPPAQKPVLLAVATRAWPGTGQVFQSGASRILYKPLQTIELKDAFEISGKVTKNRRRSERWEMKAVVYLEVDARTISGIGIDIGEHGLAIQATEPVPMRSGLAFHLTLPGTDHKLQGKADVVWASDQGRAGLFFARLSPTARKHLKHWLKKCSHAENAVRALLPPEDAVCEPVLE